MIYQPLYIIIIQTIIIITINHDISTIYTWYINHYYIYCVYIYIYIYHVHFHHGYRIHWISGGSAAFATLGRERGDRGAHWGRFRQSHGKNHGKPAVFFSMCSMEILLKAMEQHLTMGKSQWFSHGWFFGTKPYGWTIKKGFSCWKLWLRLL